MSACLSCLHEHLDLFGAQLQPLAGLLLVRGCEQQGAHGDCGTAHRTRRLSAVSACGWVCGGTREGRCCLSMQPLTRQKPWSPRHQGFRHNFISPAGKPSHDMRTHAGTQLRPRLSSAVRALSTWSSGRVLACLCSAGAGAPSKECSSCRAQPQPFLGCRCSALCTPRSPHPAAGTGRA